MLCNAIITCLLQSCLHYGQPSTLTFDEFAPIDHLLRVRSKYGFRPDAQSLALRILSSLGPHITTDYFESGYINKIELNMPAMRDCVKGCILRLLP